MPYLFDVIVFELAFRNMRLTVHLVSFVPFSKKEVGNLCIDYSTLIKGNNWLRHIFKHIVHFQIFKKFLTDSPHI